MPLLVRVACALASECARMLHLYQSLTHTPGHCNNFRTSQLLTDMCHRRGQFSRFQTLAISEVVPGEAPQVAQELDSAPTLSNVSVALPYETLCGVACLVVLDEPTRGRHARCIRIPVSESIQLSLPVSLRRRTSPPREMQLGNLTLTCVFLVRPDDRFGRVCAWSRWRGQPHGPHPEIYVGSRHRSLLSGST